MLNEFGERVGVLSENFNKETGNTKMETKKKKKTSKKYNTLTKKNQH